MKFCKSCQQAKELSCFHKDKTSKDNLSYICKNCAIERSREWYKKNKEQALKKMNEYAKYNKEKKKEYNLTHKERIRVNHAKWCAKQREKNPIYKLHDNITSLLGRSLRTDKGGKRTEEILGYSIEQLKKHLEKKFLAGMNWNNYGKNGWHVDHYIPLRVFNITSINDIDFKRAWSLTNLQPLWAHDNLVKNGKIKKPFQPSLAITG